MKLAPAWAELRKVLNEVNRVLEDLTRQIGVSYVRIAVVARGS